MQGENEKEKMTIRNKNGVKREKEENGYEEKRDEKSSQKKEKKIVCVILAQNSDTETKQRVTIPVASA